MKQLAVDVRRYEPTLALDGGPEGTTVIERLIPQAAERLRPGGWLLMEISPTIVGRVEQLLEADPRLQRRADAERHRGTGSRRPSAAKGGDMTHPLRWLALVALEQPELPTFEHLAAWHQERFPDDPQPVLAAATDKLLTFTDRRSHRGGDAHPAADSVVATRRPLRDGVVLARGDRRDARPRGSPAGRGRRRGGQVDRESGDPHATHRGGRRVDAERRRLLGPRAARPRRRGVRRAGDPDAARQLAAVPVDRLPRRANRRQASTGSTRPASKPSARARSKSNASTAARRSCSTSSTTSPTT